MHRRQGHQRDAGVGVELESLVSEDEQLTTPGPDLQPGQDGFVWQCIEDADCPWGYRCDPDAVKAAFRERDGAHDETG